MDLGIFKAIKGAKITAEILSDAIIAAIAQKALVAGDKIPPTRDLAIYLGISRTTVVKSLDQLIGRGFLTATQGAGTWVADHGETAAAAKAHVDGGIIYPWEERYSNLASSLRTMAAEANQSLEFDEINFGSQPIELIPLKQWRAALLHCSNTVDEIGFEANREVFGYRPLREAIAGFLRRNKGIICGADQIVIDSGVQSVVSPIFSLLVKAGDYAICENPGFYGAREQFESLGAHVVPVSVDEDGIVVSELHKMQQAAQWLYVAPSCQEPTGVAMSPTRRRELLQWCTTNGTAILEDDWDSDFHYRGQATDSLFSTDTTGSVVYFYSFWRLLYPLVSTGFLVIPTKLIPLFENFKNVWNRQFTLIEHRVLTELLNDGHVEKHIRLAWKHYRKLRQALIYALTSKLEKNVAVVLSSTGMHVTARFHQKWTSAQIQQAAHSAGLPVISTVAYYINEPRENEFMIRYADLAEEEIDAKVAAFAKALNQ